MEYKTGKILWYFQVCIYVLKTVTYGGIAILLYGQIDLREMHAPEDIMLLIDGPLGRMLIFAAVLETVHNFIGFMKSTRKNLRVEG